MQLSLVKRAKILWFVAVGFGQYLGPVHGMENGRAWEFSDLVVPIGVFDGVDDFYVHCLDRINRIYYYTRTQGFIGHGLTRINTDRA